MLVMLAKTWFYSLQKFLDHWILNILRAVFYILYRYFFNPYLFNSFELLFCSILKKIRRNTIKRRWWRSNLISIKPGERAKKKFNNNDEKDLFGNQICKKKMKSEAPCQAPAKFKISSDAFYVTSCRTGFNFLLQCWPTFDLQVTKPVLPNAGWKCPRTASSDCMHI